MKDTHNKLKNKGTALTTTFRGGETDTQREVPPEFRAAAELEVSDQPVPLSEGVDTLDGDQVIASKTEQQVTGERKKRVTKKKKGPIVLVERDTDKGGALVRTRTMQKAGTSSVQPSATKTVKTKNLGINQEIEEVEDSNLFTEQEYSLRKKDPVPERFSLALPTTETGVNVAGVAALPTLGAGDLEATEKQITAYVKRITAITRAGITLPVSLVTTKTNELGQLMTVTETYRVAGGPTPTNDATHHYQVVDLGEGHEVVTTEQLSDVFAKNVFQKRLEDADPIEFRALIPAVLTQSVSVGTAAITTLSTGELEHKEEQITEFTKLVESLTRAGIGLPVTITNYVMVEEYGGAIAVHSRTLAVTGTTATPTGGLSVLTAKLTQLGNGHELLETVIGDSPWSVLHGTEIDDTTSIIIPVQEQVVAAGTAGGISGNDYTEVKPIDKWRSKAITRTIDAAAYDNYSCIFAGRTQVQLPVELLSVTSYINANAGDGDYNESGTYNILNTGWGGINLSAFARAVAGCMAAEVSFEVKVVDGSNIPCTHVLIYVVSGVSEAAIRTRLGSLLSGTVNAWPKFTPKYATIVCKGGKSTLELRIAVSAHDSITVDYNGNIVHTGAQIRTHGHGSSSDLEFDTKVVRLPATIHPLIAAIGGAGIGSATVAQVTANASGSLDMGTNGGSETVGPLSVGAGFFIEYAGLGDTGATNQIPTSGKFLHRLTSEPTKDGYIRVHCEVVDAADFA